MLLAAGLGLEPSHPVLETSALANILTRNIYKAVHQTPFTTAAGILVNPFTTRAIMSQIFVLKTLSGELRGTLIINNYFEIISNKI